MTKTPMKKLSLVIDIPPQSWIRNIMKIHGVTGVKILDCIPSNGEMNEFFEIVCNPEAMAEVVNNLQETPGIRDLEVTLKMSSGKIVGTLKTTQCGFCKHFASSECFLRSAVYELDKEKIRWSFYVREKYVPQILTALEREGITYKVVYNINANVAEELTPLQERLLDRALREGYLDIPRRVGVEHLAKEFGTTKASLSITLRRALRKVVKAYLEQANP
ncbi:MAG: helix-turn-helix domain-containing protein [Nitrososphaerota archaeon]